MLFGNFQYTKYHSSYLFHSPVFKIDRREHIPFKHTLMRQRHNAAILMH